VFKLKASSKSGFRWVLASLFIEGMMLSLLIWSNLNQLHNSLSTQTQTRLNESTALLQSALSAPLVQMDYATAKAIMTETHQLKGIEYLIVLDRQNNRLIQVGWEDNHPLPKIEHEAFSDESLADNRFDTRIPLTLGGTPLGTLAIGLSTQFYTQARQDALLRSLGIALLELLFSALLLLSLNYWFGKKFIRLTEQAQAIAQGNYAQRLSTSEHHEYDQLVTAFNQMTDAVAQKINQLEAAHDEQKRLNQKVIHLVNFDSLTNVASRYALDSHLNIAINQKQAMSLFLIDLDGFKFINDHFGHHFGDQLLKEFARFISQNTPKDAFLARLSSDEFIVVINETDSKLLSVIANKLCLDIAEHSFQVNRQQLHITSSIGYSRFPDDAKDVRTLLNQADIAMYQAKAAGKNIYRAYISDYE
jgi:diguanylate cyclase (GGDEF)-like protein